MERQREGTMSFRRTTLEASQGSVQRCFLMSSSEWLAAKRNAELRLLATVGDRW